MASKSVPMGDMAKVQRQIASKRDPQMEDEAKAWIEAISGEKFPPGTYEDALRNGVILCKLMNKLLPGSVKKVQEKGGDFKMMENISNFQTAARSYGLKSEDLFQTVDLWQKSNIPAVTQCVFALGRYAQLRSDWKGPILGPKMSDENKRQFTEEQLKAGQSILTGTA